MTFQEITDFQELMAHKARQEIVALADREGVLMTEAQLEYLQYAVKGVANAALIMVSTLATEGQPDDSEQTLRSISEIAAYAAAQKARQAKRNRR